MVLPTSGTRSFSILVSLAFVPLWRVSKVLTSLGEVSNVSFVVGPVVEGEVKPFIKVLGSGLLFRYLPKDLRYVKEEIKLIHEIAPNMPVLLHVFASSPSFVENVLRNFDGEIDGLLLEVSAVVKKLQSVYLVREVLDVVSDVCKVPTAVFVPSPISYSVSEVVDTVRDVPTDLLVCFSRPCCGEFLLDSEAFLELNLSVMSRIFLERFDSTYIACGGVTDSVSMVRYLLSGFNAVMLDTVFLVKNLSEVVDLIRYGAELCSKLSSVKPSEYRRHFLLSPSRATSGARPCVVVEYCRGCGICSAICPERCITLINDVAHIDHDRCSACLLCVGACPFSAITLMKSCEVK